VLVEVGGDVVGVAHSAQQPKMTTTLLSIQMSHLMATTIHRYTHVRSAIIQHWQHGYVNKQKTTNENNNSVPNSPLPIQNIRSISHRLLKNRLYLRQNVKRR
jgi:hypothetical protein